MEFAAGVPPDYFNSNGQLWGMPVFNWDKLKAKKYNWWVQRIQKNMERFDLLRLDHFRAFSAYWAVPASEQTAINGEWIKGPGNDLFKELKNKLGALPFVAEDLGDIDDAVYALRKDMDLPGMKVLQFAFGGNMPQSPHIPHNYTANYIAYTGTHDNNTARGWFKEDADKQVKNNLEKYTGSKINEKDVAPMLIDMCMASVAKIAIIPIQDFYNLDEKARINTPAAQEGNWLWRITYDDLSQFPVKQLKKWTKKYNRV